MRLSPKATAARTVLSHARGIVQGYGGQALGQMFNGSVFSGESHGGVPHVEPYGMTSSPLPPTGDMGAEAHMTYGSSGRSHPIIQCVADRRHRPTGLYPGESFQHDDQGQGTLITRTATHVIGGGYQGQDGAGGDPSKNYATLRHVMKQKSEQSNVAMGGGGQQAGHQHQGEDPTSEFASLNGSAETIGQKQIMHSVGSNQAMAHMDTKHAMIAFSKDNVIYADKDGLWSSKPIQQKPYPYNVSAVDRPQNQGMSGFGGQGGGGGGAAISCDPSLDGPRKSRWRIGPIVCVALMLGTAFMHFAVTYASASAQYTKTLEDRVAALEQRVNILEHQLHK